MLGARLRNVACAAAVLASLSARAQDVPPPATTPTTTTTTTTTTTPPVEEISPDTRYRRGKIVFDSGDCAATLEMLSPLAVPGKLKDAKAQLDVHMMLGACYVDAKKENEASREMSAVLAIDPDYSPDPFLVPPSVIELFERQKAAMREELEAIRRAREAAKAAAADLQGGVVVERTTTIKDVPFAAAFMPFGLAQSANGENVKALVIGSIQGVLLGANAAMYWAQIATLRGRDPALAFAEDPDAEATYQALGYGHLGALVLFGVAYGVGVADALWNREDGAVIEKKQTRRPLTAAELKELKKIAPAPTAPPESAAQ
jgi:hypothetical protein